jgi:CheY-like chemotaxis protein
MPKEILIVDDSPQERKMADIYFSKEGYSVDLAKDAIEAKARLAQKHYDLVITDIMMPIESGRELAIYIKKYYGTPVILASAYVPTLSEQQRYIKVTGALGFIVKRLLPYKVEEVLQERNIMIGYCA